ncbi:SAP domain-containing protein [Pediococcus pentosaceus]|uniref:SAP domain-containing protein n=1 Tax=Pediococcus pentosaceus TaxID=1255 RepID=UPI000852B562|nr:SAP domain-containing protein [Pediococcus pentosaceus]
MMVLTLKDFEQTYFYKTELIQLCKVYGLPTYGTKAELNKYLTLYLSGTPACDIKVNRKHTTSRNKTKITLETKILGEGFSFNQEARKLFAEYFGKEEFSFKKEMVVRDLLERY